MSVKKLSNACICICNCHTINGFVHQKSCCVKCISCGQNIKKGYLILHLDDCPTYHRLSPQKFDFSEYVTHKKDVIVPVKFHKEKVSFGYDIHH